MKNNFLHLSNAKAIRNTGGGGSSQNQTNDTQSRENRIGGMSESSRTQVGLNTFHQLWRYAACLLLAFVLGIGQMWGASVEWTSASQTALPSYIGNTNIVACSGNAGFNNGGNNNAVLRVVSNSSYVTLSTSSSYKITSIAIYVSASNNSPYGLTCSDNTPTQAWAPSGCWKQGSTSMSAGSTSSIGTGKTYTFTPATATAGASYKIWSYKNGASSSTRTDWTTITVTYESASTTPATPVITVPASDPDLQTITQGETKTFEVTATGYPTPSFKWYKNTSKSTSGAEEIEGATTNSYTTSSSLAASADNYYFYCVATNASGSAQSPYFSLKVNELGADLTAHTPGVYTKAQNQSGYGAELITVSNRDYETYYIYSSSGLYLTAGNIARGATGAYNVIDQKSATDGSAKADWVAIKAYGITTSVTPNTQQFNTNKSTAYVNLRNTTEAIRLKVSGYDQFAFYGKNNSSSDATKQFTITIDGEAKINPQASSNSNAIFAFDLTTGEHYIEVSVGGNTSSNSAFYAFSLRLPSYTLTYNANGGSGEAMANTTGTGTQTLRTNTYTKAGCSFIGWATSQANANAGTVAYADEANNYNLSADATLYAVWKLDAPTITCEDNIVTMTVPGSSTVYYTTDGSTTPTSSSTAYDPSNKPEIAATRTFKAIAILANHVSSNVATQECIYVAPTPPSTKRIYMKCGDTWCEESPKFYLRSWGSEVHTVLMTQMTGCETDTYYGDIPADNTGMLFTRQNPNSEEILWEGDYFWGQSQDITIGENNLFTCTGWNNSLATFSAGTYATPTYSITFNAGVGTGTMTAIENLACGANQAITANAFEKAGYSFTNWIADVDVTVGGETVSAGSAISDQATIQNITGNITLTAAWTQEMPTSVAVDGGWRYFPGQAINLTATPTGGTSDFTYQWQKYVTNAWADIDGATAATYSIASCTISDCGSYRCVVSKLGGSVESGGYDVHIYTLNGNYDGSEWVSNNIALESGTSGKVELSLEAGRLYKFKVKDNFANYYFGNSGYMLKSEESWACLKDGADIRVFTGAAGTYTFTVDIEHTDYGTPEVLVSVAYPSVTHPAAGYIYYDKGANTWENVAAHWWKQENETATNFVAWASNPWLTQSVEICGTTYYYMPKLEGYNRVIFHNPEASAQTPDITVDASSSGKYISGNGTVWTAFASYTISFEGNGNTSGEMSAIANICPTSDQALTANAFEKTGYNFTGWVADVDVTVGESTITAGNLINNAVTLKNINSNIALTAQWEIDCPTEGTVYSASTSATDDISIAAGAANLELNSSTHKTTVSGGKMYVYNGQSSAKKLITADGFSITNGNTYFHIQLDCALEAGDTIRVKVGKNSDARGVWISSTRTDTKPGSAPACALTASGTDSGLKAVFYTVTGSDEYHGKTDFYIYRATDNGTYFNDISIIRPAKYAITFDKGSESATGEMEAQSAIEKSLVTLPACTFGAPEGKEFDAWVVTKTVGGASVTVTDGKFTMPQEAVTLTATWKTLVVKYAVTYVLNGPTGDAPTEASKAEGAEFTLAAAPSWDGHVFQGWKWTDATPEDHVVAAEAAFTMPAYAVTFTAQWKLENDAAFSNKVAFENAEVDLSSLFTSSSDGTVTYALKEESENASVTEGVFTASAAGEYVVVATQAATSTYVAVEKEATIEVLASEVEDIFIFNKKADYGGEGKCLTADQANTDDGVHQYTAIAYEGFAGMGRAEADNTECILTFSVKPAYSSALGIKSICTYGKFEESLGGQISWDGGTSWEDLAAYTDGKKEFDAPGTFPTSFKIKFMGVSKKSGGLWWRNALVTLEKKKAITNTAIDLTAVKINNVAISAANLTTLKTASAYALDIEDEYVTAPTVKFNKQTVITYEDASEVESNVEIPVVASVNAGGKWEAQTEINAITYTVTMAKADAFIVNYYQADGETLIGSENVAVNGYPTGTGIAPTPIDYKESYWTLNSAEVALNTVTSDEAGTIINLVAAYRTAYATSINIEKWVLDNRKNNTAFRAVLDARHYQYANLNDLDSLTTEKNESDRNYPFLGQKIKTTGGYISFLLKAGSEMHVKFGNIPAAVNLIVNDGEPVAKSASFDYTAGGSDEIIKLATTTDGTVVFKQIMIDEAIETVVLPAIVTYDANGGSFAKTSEKYTGTPLVIADATPASEDYLFDGWHLGTVDGAAIDATSYEPTKNITLVAKYVLKPSPFSLSALTYKIGDGAATAVGYEEGTYEYTVKLPYAHSYDAITVAATLSDGTSSLKAAISQPATVPGDASFTVVADDESEQEYVIHFVKEAKDGLSIIKATVSGGDESAGFDATGLYAGKGYANTSAKKLNTNNYVGVQLKAGQSFQAGDKLYVVTTTDADRGYIELYQESAGTNLVKALGVRDASAGIELPSEAYGLNELYIVRKTSDGDQSWNGTVNYVEVTRPMNPVLKSITFDGNKIDVTGTTVEETLPYATDLTAVTAEYFWNGAGTAVVTTNEGAWAWGENTYVLTDKDGDATTYTISLTRAERSTDATLSSLTVNGNAMELVADKYEYTYEYPYGTNPATVPVVAAEANDAHKHSLDITQATNATGTAEIVVVAEDETTTLTYTVRFCISRNQTLVIYDGKESEPMNAIANPGSLEPGLEWTIKDPNSTSASSADAVVFEGKSYKKYVQLFTSATASTTRYMTITIPENYLAKFRLVGCGNGNSDRSLFISKEITSTRDESIAFVHTTSATIDGMTSDFQFPGTYYLCCDNSIRLYELSVTLYPIDYTRNVTDGRLGTICLQHGGIMRGAAVYEVAYFNPDNEKIYFDEVLNGEMEPGMPYVFLPDQGNNDQLVVTYGNNAPAAVAGNHNGLYGSFTEELLTPNTVNYILQSNKYWYVNSAEVYVGENRAYFKVAEIYGYAGEPEPAPAQGRRRVVMDAGAQAPQTPTGFENGGLINGENGAQKVLIGGKMFILRGEKMYDATGRLVK